MANRRLALGERTSLLCRMDADPVEGLEVSWYLSANNDQLGLQPTKQLDGQQQSRPTHLTWPPERQAGATSIEAQSHWRKLITAPDGKSEQHASTSSQLNYLVESGADYGLVYCLARNSVGPQARACAYQIQPPGKFSAQPSSRCLRVWPTL